MNEKVKAHYESLLADIYSWMAGNFREKVNQTREFFIKNNIKPSSTHLAIDLGSGHGIQSAALVEIGFEVTAVDFSEKLLLELKQNTANKVKTINGDITEFKYPAEIKPELIICMGDTLTHLPSIDIVNVLMRNAAENLHTNGKFVLSYRDLSTELTGTSRFIPVKSDDTRILTCFLEYFDSYVMINDILHEKINDKWEMKVSSYPKLRLPVNEVLNKLEENGLKAVLSTVVQGMNYIIAEKN
ncbi:MAG: class I SAM-dependent methyltransferase [Ignavibacteria bacterium]|nr:class I SAM-dependent methyltransferase [Ignavibacteria bacterium]